MLHWDAMPVFNNSMNKHVLTLALRCTSIASLKPYTGEATKMDAVAITHRAAAHEGGGRHPPVPAEGPENAVILAATDSPG